MEQRTAELIIMQDCRSGRTLRGIRSQIVAYKSVLEDTERNLVRSQDLLRSLKSQQQGRKNEGPVHSSPRIFYKNSSSLRKITHAIWATLKGIATGVELFFKDLGEAIACINPKTNARTPECLEKERLERERLEHWDVKVTGQSLERNTRSQRNRMFSSN